MSTYARIEELEIDLQNAKRDYLKRFGWKETSSMPGSYWMWARDFADLDALAAKWHADHPTASPHVPYGRVTASLDTAVSMTRKSLDRDEDDAEGDGE